MGPNIRSCPRKIASHWAFTPRGFLRRPLISLDAQGVITGVESVENPDSLAGVEFHEGMLIPGMVNAHCHLELSHLYGALARDGGLAGFARGMASAARQSPGRSRAMGAQDAAMWAHGIAAVGDVCNGEASFAIKSRSRVRYHSFLELFGMNAAGAEHLSALGERASATRLAWSATPHSTYSLQSAPFAAAVAASRGPLSIHFMEDRAEEELFLRRGPLWEWYLERGFTPDFLHYGSPAGRVVAQVPRDREVMLVHNTFIGERDARMLVDHFGTRLTFVLCPRSNLHITGALPPVETLRRVGANIAMGTDSLASNHDLSMVEEMKALAGVPLEELLRWATAGGARALGMEDTLGSIEIGKAPGIALIENLDPQTLRSTANTHIRRIA